MTHRAPDEMRADYVSAMGEEHGDQFYRLVAEGVQIHLEWIQYLTLFGFTPERIKLLNESAPAFFASIEDILWDDLLLHIARLTEPVIVAGKETLTLQRLPAFVDDSLRHLDAPKPRLASAETLHVEVRMRMERWRELLRAHVPQARQMLRKVIDGRITFTPQPDSRTYQFSIPGTVALFSVV